MGDGRIFICVLCAVVGQAEWTAALHIDSSRLDHQTCYPKEVPATGTFNQSGHCRL